MDRDRLCLKVIIVGDSNVGKTSLLDRFIKDQYTDQYKATIGSDFLTKDIEVNDKSITLQLWDTAGQERFRGLGSAFYRGADGVIIVYDVTVRQTFDNVETWKNEFLAHGAIEDPTNFPISVIGNKLDLGQSDVPKALVTEMLESSDNISHYQVSAKDRINIDTVFTSIIETVTDSYLNTKANTSEEEFQPTTVNLNKAPEPTQEKNCPC